MELPLGDLDGVSIGGDDLIFCGATAYSRIQVYGPTGKFIRAINTYGKLLNFYVTPQGLIRVKAGGWLRNYSLDGKFLGKTRWTSKHGEEFRNVPKSAFMDKQGNTYTVARYSVIFPRIVRTTAEGQTSVVVSQPWYLWAVQFPFPAFFFGGFGLFTAAVCDFVTKRRKRKQKQLETPDSSPSTGNEPSLTQPKKDAEDNNS